MLWSLRNDDEIYGSYLYGVLERHIERRVVLSWTQLGTTKEDFNTTFNPLFIKYVDDTMQVDAKTPIPVLKVDGGAAKMII